MIPDGELNAEVIPPPPPAMAPHSVVYPSKPPVVLLYLKSPATPVGLSAVVPTGTLIDPVPPKSTPSAVVSSFLEAS